MEWRKTNIYGMNTIIWWLKWRIITIKLLLGLCLWVAAGWLRLSSFKYLKLSHQVLETSKTEAEATVAFFLSIQWVRLVLKTLKLLIAPSAIMNQLSRLYVQPFILPSEEMKCPCLLFICQSDIKRAPRQRKGAAVGGQIPECNPKNWARRPRAMCKVRGA